MRLSISSLKSDEYREQKKLDKEWATAIKERDGWCCVICGNKWAPNAHHIIPREQKEYRYCMDNGITLCVAHHKFSRLISAHNAPFAFFMWLDRWRNDYYRTAKMRCRDICKAECVLCSD